MKSGTRVYLCLGDEVLAEVTPYEGQDEWREQLENCEEWSIGVNITIDYIDFNETWFLAYQARMYANQFKS